MGRLRLRSWVSEQSSYVEGHRAIMLCLENLAKDPVTQTLGLTILFDYEGTTVDKVLRLEIGLIRRLMEYLQECTPMRLKVAHNVRQGPAFDMLFALVRLLLKKKFVERLRLHGVKFDDLHKDLSPDVLPKEYGGQAPPLDFDGFWKGLESHDDDYRKDSSYGYTRRHDMDFATEAEIEDELSFL
ncbi:alpha-tocopherol transfer protein-like [Haemaphysalis longicornis]